MKGITVNEVIEMAETELRTVASEAGALILDAGSMDSIMRLADIMAKGRATVPTHFQGNPADCAAVIMQSIQWKMNPFAVAQKTHVVNGMLGYEAQLVNAVIQSSGVTTERFTYEWYGDWTKIIGKSKVLDMPAKDGKKAYQFRVPDYDMRAEDGLGVRVSTTLKGESEPRTLDLLMVQASVRNSPLWATDPKQQLAYLAVKRWTRLYAPDVILGVYTPDEMDESRLIERDITPARPVRQNAAQIAQRTQIIEPAENHEKLLADLEAVADNGAAALEKSWLAITKEKRQALAGNLESLKARALRADAPLKENGYVPE